MDTPTSTMVAFARLRWDSAVCACPTRNGGVASTPTPLHALRDIREGFASLIYRYKYSKTFKDNL